MTPDLIQLLTTGGALGVLAVVFVLLLRGDLQTKASVDGQRASDAKLAAELATARDREVTKAEHDRDEWKAIAKDAVKDAGELGEALTVRNRIDEDLLRRLGVTVKADI